MDGRVHWISTKTAFSLLSDDQLSSYFSFDMYRVQQNVMTLLTLNV